MKTTKYVKVFVVQGNYPGNHGWEDLCCDTDRKAARAELRNYNANESYPHRLITRRVLREKYETGAF